jgi:hypothetical protein
MKVEVHKTLFKVTQDSSTLLQTSLTGTFIAGAGGTGQFSIVYSTPPTNNPDDASRQGTPQSICIWAVTNVSAIYTSEPIRASSVSITGTSSAGSVTIRNFTRTMNTTYVIAYCYGTPDYKSGFNGIGAVLIFQPGENTGTAVTPTLSQPVIIGSSSVYSSFTTPSGNNPYKYSNWYGLALGSGITNDGKQDWIAAATCDASMQNNNATAYLDNVPLTVGATYSFAFGYCPPAGRPSVGMYFVFTAESGE